MEHEKIKKGKFYTKRELFNKRNLDIRKRKLFNKGDLTDNTENFVTNSMAFFFEFLTACFTQIFFLRQDVAGVKRNLILLTNAQAKRLVSPNQVVFEV